MSYISNKNVISWRSNCFQSAISMLSSLKYCLNTIGNSDSEIHELLVISKIIELLTVSLCLIMADCIYIPADMIREVLGKPDDYVSSINIYVSDEEYTQEKAVYNKLFYTQNKY